MSSIVADGVSHHIWAPSDEDRDFRPLVEAHVNQIFGKPSFALVKVLLNPLDFVGFDGLITDEDLHLMVLMDSKGNPSSGTGTRKSIERTIDNDHYDWHVLRVDEDRKVKIE